MNQILSNKLTIFIIKSLVPEELISKLTSRHIRLDCDFKMIRFNFIILVILFTNHTLNLWFFNRNFNIVNSIFSNN